MHLELGSLPSKALLLTLYSGILISSSSGKSIPHHLSHDKTRVALREASSDAAGFDYATQKIRGVNIGGWLVTEPWITPSVYETNNPAIIDEFTLCQILGKKEAGRRLREHWDSFYTEADFHTIKSFGLNHVRIPIGYWAFDVSGGEPYVQGQFDYLLQAVGWSRNAGLKVLIDLHGGPGSQNGFDNSGKRGAIGWDEDQGNVERTKAALAKLTHEFSKPQYAQVVVGIQALNEPAGFKNEHMVNTIKDFYKDSYDIVRHTSGPQTHLLLNIHDAFLPLSTWANTFPPPQHHGVSLDTHIYTVFTPEGNKMSEQERIHEYCKKIPDIQASQSKIWTWVGEFTPAPTDCAPLLNGIGRGSRYDGSFEGSTRVGSCESKTGLTSEFSEEYKESLGKFFEIQTKVYEHGSGWFMWTFKAEKADDWSYEAGVKGGWIPKNLDHKKYGVSC
ncbi:hypothetical protein Pst134EB_010901 [Puccinia striiformis f. sp. tritici]|uniref:glucan 1,3-beta-glucosidase n=1 Tax=Puccinia striiformis f. sp. tritici PST-78 TaxID=1165861 RepID=A0A0L0V4X6_9BASI|nr:hypothetical protein Pst134EB_010901 [Puccinia striiformis f. sp. tritici]KNE94251.1 hypothetical protein PSTG_12383 [Puccinia striiformis f. sp. tritici PST-78]